MARRVVNSLIVIERVTQVTMEIWVKIDFTITKFATIMKEFTSQPSNKTKCLAIRTSKYYTNIKSKHHKLTT